MAQFTSRPVPGQLQDGSLITIKGSVYPQAQGFSINLAIGPGDLETSDVALHVNPRFNENCVPRNTFESGCWRAEIRDGPPGVPVNQGAPFECIILVQRDKYMVSFNERHYCEFAHRIPKEMVKFVMIRGDVQINDVSFGGPGMQGGHGFGQPMPGQPMPGQPMPGQPMPGQPMPGQPMHGFGQPGGMGQPGAPQCMRIQGGLFPGRIIYINATPTPTAQRFSVNLKYQEHGGDVAFHFNPRFNEHTVCKNSLQNGSWGQEEKATAPFPFIPGTPFALMVLGDPQEFKVAVNGAHYTEFRLRNPNLQAIQWVEVEGDVSGVTINAP